MPDRIAALTALLKADPTISAKIQTRAFAHELPDVVINRMPLYAIVLRPAGGGSTLGGGYQQFSDQRIDIHHYGGTPEAAYGLYADVESFLKQMPRTVVGDTLIHWARAAGGPNQMREPGKAWPGGVPDNSVNWPFTVASWQVLAADIPVGVAA